MTNQIINQHADDWARWNLVGTIEIKPFHNSALSQILVVLSIGFLFLIFLGIPALIFYSSAVRYATQGWSREVSRGVTFGAIFLLASIVLASFIIFYVWKNRRNHVRFLNPEGVYTRGGKKYYWRNLKYLKFESVQTEVRGDFYLRLLTRFMYAGVQKIKVVMVFEDETATAIIPPLITNQRHILELLNTIPTERPISR